MSKLSLRQLNIKIQFFSFDLLFVTETLVFFLFVGNVRYKCEYLGVGTQFSRKHCYWYFWTIINRTSWKDKKWDPKSCPFSMRTMYLVHHFHHEDVVEEDYIFLKKAGFPHPRCHVFSRDRVNTKKKCLPLFLPFFILFPSFFLLFKPFYFPSRFCASSSSWGCRILVHHLHPGWSWPRFDYLFCMTCHFCQWLGGRA